MRDLFVSLGFLIDGSKDIDWAICDDVSRCYISYMAHCCFA